jgi:ketosteroid isomerase-like protein
MSLDNLEVVRLAHEAWNRDDLDAALSLIHPDAQWGPVSSDLFPGVELMYSGHAGVREWWKTVKEPFEYFKADIERTLEEGNTVVTAVRFEAIGKTSGAKVEWRIANVWELDGGLIVKFAAYRSVEEALEAAQVQG